LKNFRQYLNTVRDIFPNSNPTDKSEIGFENWNVRTKVGTILKKQEICLSRDETQKHKVVPKVLNVLLEQLKALSSSSAT